MHAVRSTRRSPGLILGYEGRYPVVPVTVKRFRNKTTLLKIGACPYCGLPHIHGGGDVGEEPREYQGHRGSHCVERVANDVGYVLRIGAEEKWPRDTRPKVDGAS